MVENSPDWIPEGWTVQVKLAKNGRNVKCYLDPSTGYRFYSKPDVFRYLKTIKHNSCTSRQKKVGPGMPSLGKVVIERSTADGLPAGWIKEIKIRMNENGIRRDPPPPGAKRQKLMHQKTRRRLFSATASADTGSSEMSNLSLPENQGSRQTKQLFSKPKFALEPSTETLQEKLLVENGKYAESKKSSGRRNSDLQKDKGSKRKSKNKDCNLPCRSSKRLAGLKPDLVGNSGSSEQALAVADKISGKSEVIPALGVVMGSLDNTACCQLEVVLEAEPGHHASRAIEAPSDVEQSKKDNRHLEDEAVQEEEAGKLETGKKTGDEPELPPMDFPFMDVWSDPCLEFAFKTLTGAIPIEDNLEIEGYFQQQIDSSHTQNSSLTLPDFGLPSSQFDAQEKSVPRQHFASKPSVLPKEM